MVVNDVHQAAADETLSQIAADGGEAIAFIGSVTDAEFGEKVVAETMQRYGGLDIIVNNAGYLRSNPIQRMSDEDFDLMMELHVAAPFRLLRAAQPRIKALANAEKANNIVNHRKVVNVASIAGVYGAPLAANYSAAKAGVIGLTKSLSKEWGRYNVNVNAAAFGIIKTPLFDKMTSAEDPLTAAFLASNSLGRLGTTEEAAGAIYMLCSPESNYITGHVLECSGGSTTG